MIAKLIFKTSLFYIFIFIEFKREVVFLKQI